MSDKMFTRIALGCLALTSAVGIALTNTASNIGKNSDPVQTMKPVPTGQMTQATSSQPTVQKTQYQGDHVWDAALEACKTVNAPNPMACASETLNNLKPINMPQTLSSDFNINNHEGIVGSPAFKKMGEASKFVLTLKGNTLESDGTAYVAFAGQLAQAVR